MRTIIAILVVIWLVIGAAAAFQRDYFSDESTNCAEVGNIALTIVAGPLNYMGANPKVECDVPEPSQ